MATDSKWSSVSNTIQRYIRCVPRPRKLARNSSLSSYGSSPVVMPPLTVINRLLIEYWFILFYLLLLMIIISFQRRSSTTVTSSMESHRSAPLERPTRYYLFDLCSLTFNCSLYSILRSLSEAHWQSGHERFVAESPSQDSGQDWIHPFPSLVVRPQEVR